MRKFLSYLMALCTLILAVSVITPDAEAIGVTGASISNPGTVDQGGTYTVSYAVSASDSMAADLAISVSGGGVFAGATSTASVNGNMIVLGGVDGVTSVSGSISFRVDGAAPVTVSLSGSVTSLNDFTSAPVNVSTTIAVRSTADIQAAQAAAAEEAARQQAAAEEAARQQQAAAAEAARQASIAAEATREQAERQASIDASILAEQQSIQAEKAAEEESINVSIQESASIEESKLAVSASEEASKARESEAESRSIRESESKEDLTRAYKVRGEYYVPMDYHVQKFIFAVAGTEFDAPEGFEKTELVVNCQDVLAFQRPGTTAKDVYLVYGTFKERNDPALYFFDKNSELLIPYEAVKDEIVSITPTPAGSEEGQQSSETEAPTSDGITMSVKETAGVAVVALILGVVGTLLAVLIGNRRKRSREEAEELISVRMDQDFEETSDPSDSWTEDGPDTDPKPEADEMPLADTEAAEDMPEAAEAGMDLFIEEPETVETVQLFETQTADTEQLPRHRLQIRSRCSNRRPRIWPSQPGRRKRPKREL